MRVFSEGERVYFQCRKTAKWVGGNVTQLSGVTRQGYQLYFVDFDGPVNCGYTGAPMITDGEFHVDDLRSYAELNPADRTLLKVRVKLASKRNVTWTPQAWSLKDGCLHITHMTGKKEVIAPGAWLGIEELEAN